MTSRGDNIYTMFTQGTNNENTVMYPSWLMFVPTHFWSSKETHVLEKKKIQTHEWHEWCIRQRFSLVVVWLCRPLFNYFLLFSFLFSFSLDPFTLLLKPSSCSRIFDFEACGNPWGAMCNCGDHVTPVMFLNRSSEPGQEQLRKGGPSKKLTSMRRASPASWFPRQFYY